MKKKFLLSITIVVALLTFASNNCRSQCHLIRTTSSSTDTLTYTFSGGTSASYGCTPIDPNYWMSGSGEYVIATFVNPQNYPAFRVWGMNTDDSASVTVNASAYPMNSSSASYKPKVICGVSPGPDGILFSHGKMVGANDNNQGNYSYQDVQLNATGVTTIKVTSISGEGWGFAGILVNCSRNISDIKETSSSNQLYVYPNPATDFLYFNKLAKGVKESVQVYSCTGQLLFEDDNFTSGVIDIKKLNLADGIYFLKCFDTKNYSVNKFAVKH